MIRTGHAGLDLMTVALGAHLFVNPAGVAALATYWVETSVGGPRDVSPALAYSALLRRLVVGTLRCQLSLYLLPMQRSAAQPLEFHGVLTLFPPAAADAGIVEPDAGLSLTLAGLEDDTALRRILPILGELVDPDLGRLADGQHPFRLRNETPIQHHVWLSDFRGDELLTTLVDRRLLVAMACVRIVEAVIGAVGPTVATRQQAALAMIFGTLAAELQALATPPDEDAAAADDWRTLSALFTHHAYQATELLGAIRRHSEPLTAAALDRRRTLLATLRQPQT